MIALSLLDIVYCMIKYEILAFQPLQMIQVKCLSYPLPLLVAVRVSAPDDMPNEMTGEIELSVETLFSIPAPPEFSTVITLKSGTAKCKTLHCI